MPSYPVLASAGFACLALVAASGAPLGAQDFPMPHVTVTGEASRAVEPNMAEARAGVVSQAKTAREASETNARAMTAVLSALQEAGIEKRDIQTSSFRVQPLFTRPQQEARAEPPRISGYQVANTVTVKIRDLGRLSDVLDRLLSAGANSIYGIEFEVAEPAKLLDEIRAAAVADAKRKAALYAKAADAQIGRVLALTESSVTVPRPVLRAVAAPQSASTLTAPGEETLRVSITATFELSR